MAREDVARQFITEGEAQLDRGDFEEALTLFLQATGECPIDLIAISYVNMLETILLRRYLGMLTMQSIPRINPEVMDRLTQLDLKGHEGYLLTQIDGRTTIKSLIYICGLGKFSTLRMLNKFLQSHITLLTS
jgi:hypothetical protein